MKLVQPSIDVPGDNERELAIGPDMVDETAHVRERIMARTGELVGIDLDHAVWRFGFMPGSESAQAFGVEIPDLFPADSEGESEPPGPHERGFLWVLATRRTAKVKDTFRGYALELPGQFRDVIEWEPPSRASQGIRRSLEAIWEVLARNPQRERALRGAGVFDHLADIDRLRKGVG